MANTPTTTKKTTVSLPKSVFAVEVPNHELLKLAYDAYLANARVSTATTKTRGEVSGGGRKPWQQKGTGRARVGSIRSPIWRGGGITFGPLGNENHKKRLNKASKRVATRQALTVANQDKKLHVTELPKLSGKTKELVDFLEKGKFNGRRVLIVVDLKTPELLRASKNLQNVEVVSATYLSVFHILNAHAIVITGAAVKAVEAWLTSTATKTVADKGGKQ
jgi:large subunit ribosomal protein L4